MQMQMLLWLCFFLVGVVFYSEKVRKDGAKAWLQNPGNPKAAAQAFKKMQPDAATKMPRPEKNLKRWAEQWDDRDSFADKPRSGRPPTIQDTSLLAKCAAALKRVRKIGGVWRHYESITEAAKYESVLRKAMDTYNVTAAHLLKAVHRFDPSLVRGKEKLRRYLDNSHRQQRVKIAKRLLRLPLKYFKKVFWLDAKHLYIVPPTGHVYCDAAERSSLFVEDPKAKGKPMCLHYYAMVNWFTGAVYIIWVTGTTGMKRLFLVSHRASPLHATALQASATYFH